MSKSSQPHLPGLGISNEERLRTRLEDLADACRPLAEGRIFPLITPPGGMGAWYQVERNLRHALACALALLGQPLPEHLVRLLDEEAGEYPEEEESDA